MILLETLSDHLSFHGISKEQATVLFGRSPKTLKRWEHDTPPHILRLIQLLGRKPAFPDNWQGWFFESDYLIDPAGNKYHQKDVNTIFMQRQLTNSLTGDKMTVCSLKQHLEDRLSKQPILKISLVESTSETELKHWSIAL